MWSVKKHWSRRASITSKIATKLNNSLWALALTLLLLAFEPWLKPPYYWTLSHGSNPHIFSLWAMAQTPIFLAFESINYWTLSHGSNSSIIGLWAMALTHQLLDFEPWLKPPKNRTLSHGSEKFPSHGSNPHFLGVWAMAQTYIWHADFRHSHLWLQVCILFIYCPILVPLFNAQVCSILFDSNTFMYMDNFLEPETLEDYGLTFGDTLHIIQVSAFKKF